MNEHNPTEFPPTPHGDEFAEFLARFAKPLFLGMTAVLFTLIFLGAILVGLSAFGVI